MTTVLLNVIHLLLMDYSSKIKDIRVRKGLSQNEVATKIGISQAAYGKIESGFTKSISIEIGKGIARVLDVSFVELFEVESDEANRRLILDQIDELETEISKLKKSLTEKDILIYHFRDRYKQLYLEKIELDFLDYLELLNQIYKAMKNFEAAEYKSKFEEQLRNEKEYMKDKIAEIKKEGIFSEFEILDILFQNDFNIVDIVESDEDIANKLTLYWSEYFDISQSKVEQFLNWFNKKWDSKLKSKRAALHQGSNRGVSSTGV